MSASDGEHGASADREQVLEELRARRASFLLTTHENPDGDALGSLRRDARDPDAARQGLADVHVARTSSRCPTSTASCTLDGLVSEPPADVAERTIVFLDCGNIDRMPVDFLQRDGAAHPQHRPPPRQHALRHGEPRGARRRSCTAEIVWDLSKELGVELTPTIAEALYVGLVTDTGRFMYENTAPRAHRMAAELIEAGVDVARGLPPRCTRTCRSASSQLLARALAQVERYDDGALTRRPPHARGLRRDAAPRRTTPRASSTTCAPSRARAVAALVRELLGRRPRGHAQGVAARHRRPRRRVARSRARSGRRRPPPGGRLHDRDWP